MKNLSMLLLAAFVLVGCTNIAPSYAPTQFSNENYQKNIANAIEYADNFVDFDYHNVPSSSLDSADMARLLQADIAFNQGDYAQAADNYYLLSVKYQDPRIIYKAIVCYEHGLSSPLQNTRLSNLINQLQSVAPNSKISQLFAIRSNLEKGDLGAAKDDLQNVLSSDHSKTRSILLFLATIISNNSNAYNKQTLGKFGLYISKTYLDYPEAYLFAMVAYSITADEINLLEIGKQVNIKYPNWEVPTFWVSGILLKKSSGLESAVSSEEYLGSTSSGGGGCSNRD